MGIQNPMTIAELTGGWITLDDNGINILTAASTTKQVNFGTFADVSINANGLLIDGDLHNTGSIVCDVTLSAGIVSAFGQVQCGALYNPTMATSVQSPGVLYQDGAGGPVKVSP